jgi:hypothetical protein
VCIGSARSGWRPLLGRGCLDVAAWTWLLGRGVGMGPCRGDGWVQGVDPVVQYLLESDCFRSVCGSHCQLTMEVVAIMLVCRARCRPVAVSSITCQFFRPQILRVFGHILIGAILPSLVCVGGVYCTCGGIRRNQWHGPHEQWRTIYTTPRCCSNWSTLSPQSTQLQGWGAWRCCSWHLPDSGARCPTHADCIIWGGALLLLAGWQHGGASPFADACISVGLEKARHWATGSDGQHRHAKRQVGGRGGGGRCRLCHLSSMSGGCG